MEALGFQPNKVKLLHSSVEIVRRHKIFIFASLVITMPLNCFIIQKKKQLIQKVALGVLFRQEWLRVVEGKVRRMRDGLEIEVFVKKANSNTT